LTKGREAQPPDSPETTPADFYSTCSRRSLEVYFLKLPGRWHEFIGNLCTNLGRETPGTADFRINIDHKISEAEARASDSEAIPFGETPEQRKREFQEALRKILRVCRDRNSSNQKVWTEALHLLDNPRVHVLNWKRPKDSPKR